MPTTEAPRPEPPSTEDESRARALPGRASRKGAYDTLEGYDLLHVIDDLEDERSRALLREKIWIALILHLLLFAYIILAPRYIFNVHVREPKAQKNKQMTYLDLPPDALKQLKPEKPAPLSDKNRQQQSPKPVPDRKALEAMRRAGPPSKAPAPDQQPKPAPQVAQAPPAAPQPKPAPAPPAKSESAQVEAPKPQPTKPNFSNPQQTPGQEIAQAARQATQGAESYGGGDMGADAPSVHSGEQGAVDILSDTLGVDFGPYIRKVIYETKRAWYPIIPEIAQPPISKQGRALIRFKILPDGSVAGMTLEGPSGDVSLDRAAWGGILGASPFPHLPKNFKGPFLELRFYFLYNQNPGVQ